MTVRTSAGESWTQPIPEQVCREMDVCFAIDILGVALLAIRTERQAASKSLSELPADATHVTPNRLLGRGLACDDKVNGVRFGAALIRATLSNVLETEH